MVKICRETINFLFFAQKNKILPRKEKIYPNFWKIYPKNKNLPSHLVQPLSVAQGPHRLDCKSTVSFNFGQRLFVYTKYDSTKGERSKANILLLITIIFISVRSILLIAGCWYPSTYNKERKPSRSTGSFSWPMPEEEPPETGSRKLTGNGKQKVNRNLFCRL